jgi:hypothetical protein
MFVIKDSNLIGPYWPRTFCRPIVNHQKAVHPFPRKKDTLLFSIFAGLALLKNVSSNNLINLETFGTKRTPVLTFDFLFFKRLCVSFFPLLLSPGRTFRYEPIFSSQHIFIISFSLYLNIMISYITVLMGVLGSMLCMV